MTSSTQLINAQIETVLQESIFPDLLKGRKDFDLPHTKAVVHWMKELLRSLDDPKLDPQVMITAAYAHDWGYIGLFDGVNSSDPKEIAKRKPLHMERGSKMIRELIEEKLSNFFTEEQKDAVAHLVLMHDRVEDLKTDEEILIMEGDTLGMLDTDLVKPTFSKEDNQRFMEREIKTRRKNVFTHHVAIKELERLTKVRENYYLSP